MPLLHEDAVKFAASNFIVPNETVGANGAVEMIASRNVVEQIADELRRRGYRPQVIGEILGKGDGRLKVPREVGRLVAQPSLREEFTVEGSIMAS